MLIKFTVTYIHEKYFFKYYVYRHNSIERGLRSREEMALVFVNWYTSRIFIWNKTNDFSPGIIIRRTK